MFKSNSCNNKKHELCNGHHEILRVQCDCFCHHEDNCECFACKIRTVGYGTVPGGYKSLN